LEKVNTIGQGELKRTNWWNRWSTRALRGEKKKIQKNTTAWLLKRRNYKTFGEGARGAPTEGCIDSKGQVQ